MKITIREHVSYDQRRAEWFAKAESINADHWAIAHTGRPTEKEARDSMPELRASVLLQVKAKHPNENVEVA